MIQAKIYAIESDGRVVYVGVTTQRWLSSWMATHASHARHHRRGAKKLGEWLRTQPEYTVRVLEECGHAERVFSSMREAADVYGISVATVCLHANGKRASPKFEFIE